MICERCGNDMRDCACVSGEPEAASGGSPAGRNSVPDEIRYFNWGAFIFSWIWAFTHKLRLMGFSILVIGFTYKSINLFDDYLITYFHRVCLIKYQYLKLFINYTTLSLVAVDMLLVIYLGFKGNELAWRKGVYMNADELKRAERAWSRNGIILMVFIFIGFCVGFISIEIINRI
jgi:hypothetical protein